jgi:4-amino-4-deoxy-L-arabinose transferase-like glycosyltransferase
MIRALYDDHVAFFSSLLFMTSPAVAYFTRVSMSEMPALACLVLTALAFKSTCAVGESEME